MVDTPVPPVTVHTVIVCLLESAAALPLTAQVLHRYTGVAGSPQPRFWASPATWLWQRRQLYGLRRGHPAYCAGGPLGLLDLSGMRTAAATSAAIRYRMFATATHGTRPATPWPAFHTRHLADPHGYPWEQAVADFHHQPRVDAIRMHNAATPAHQHIPLREVEMLQAGAAAYQHYSACAAVAADALLCTDGRRLSPDSDTFTDRVTYLQQAGVHLAGLETTQRLIAVTV